MLPTIDSFLPDTFREEDNVTYIEPFVGGGAMLFFMLQKYPNIKNAIANDINPHLIKTYTIIRDEPFSLIDILNELQYTFKALEAYDRQKEFYLDIRRRFNQSPLTDIEKAAYIREFGIRILFFSTKQKT